MIIIGSNRFKLCSSLRLDLTKFLLMFKVMHNRELELFLKLT